MSHDARLRSEVRSYYDTVSEYIEKELLGRSDRAFWEELVREEAERLSATPSILELGCGTGRVTRLLASGSSSPPDKPPATVVGIDLSRKMLRRARKRLEERSNVLLLLSDMRTTRLARTFDLVVAANDPFTHLVEDEDRKRALETVARHLAPGGRGRFILDAFWLGEDRLERAAGPDGYERERRVSLDDDGPEETLRIRERWTCRPGTRRCSVRYEYRMDGRSPDRATFRARLWSPEELRARLEAAGLRVAAVWGGFDRRPFEQADASHLIVDARTPL